MRMSDWAASRIGSSPNGWVRDLGTPAEVAKNVLGLPADMEAWAAREFPGQTAEELPDLIRREVVELEAALQTLRFLKEAPEPLTMARDLGAATVALAMTLRANREAQREAADVAIFAMRAILLMGGDPHQVIWEKWQEVRERTYRKGEPESEADAIPEQSGGNADALTYVIFWSGAYLTAEPTGPEGEGHWTAKIEHATRFDRIGSAMSFLEQTVIVAGPGGATERLCDLPGVEVRGYNSKGVLVRTVNR